MVPVIQAATVKALRPVLEEIGHQAAQVVIDGHSGIAESFRTSPYSDFLEAGGDYIQACHHILFGLILEEMAANGALPSFQKPVPEYFGVFLVAGKLY